MTEPAPKFPVLWPYERAQIAEYEQHGIPRHVPWSVVAPHEAQAKSNHDQTLARLAERGGLDAHELYAVLRDKPWREIRYIPISSIAAKLREIVDAAAPVP